MSEVDIKQNPKKKKKLTKFGKMLLDAILVLSLCVAAFSGYKLYQGKKEYKEAEKAYGDIRQASSTLSEKGKVIDWDSLFAICNDVVGWIYLEDSTIDYPIVQAEDNDYYLRRLLDGTWNNSGSIFVDYENYPGFVDKNNVLYGHHMLEAPYMFADVEKYRDQEFYDTHKVIEIYTPNDKRFLVYPLAGVYDTGSGDYVRLRFDGEQDFLDYVDSFVSRSTFESDEQIEPGDRIVLLSTCEYKVNTVDGRYALIGKIVEDTSWGN